MAAARVSRSSFSDYQNADSLATSRSSCLAAALVQKICCLADIEVLERNDADEFLILACDGIWDVVSNEGIVVFVNYYLEVGGLMVEGARRKYNSIIS